MMRLACSLFALAITLLAVAGCKSDSSKDGSRAVTLQLNWKPEPQFGGFYAAALPDGTFAKHNLNVTVQAGGVGTPTVQMVGAGRVDFAVVSADEVVMARANGNNVVALLAVYQDCPQGLMTRADRGFTGIGDVFTHPGTVALQKGLPYAQLLEKQYGFEKVKVVPSPGGDISVFLQDPAFTQQCFVTSEPLAAKKAGVETRTFLVKEAGYNPYTTVLVTREDVLQSNPQLVHDMTQACREGWQAYLADPAAANAAMQQLNPGQDAATMAASAEVQKPLILAGEAQNAANLGVMTLDRWKTLCDQLLELKVIEQAVDPAACFRTLEQLAAK